MQNGWEESKIIYRIWLTFTHFLSRNFLQVLRSLFPSCVLQSRYSTSNPRLYSHKLSFFLLPNGTGVSWLDVGYDNASLGCCEFWWLLPRINISHYITSYPIISLSPASCQLNELRETFQFLSWEMTTFKEWTMNMIIITRFVGYDMMS